jgi:hypothetical protein
MYFGGNRRFKFRLVLSCSKFYKNTETAFKLTYLARIPEVVFAHYGAERLAIGNELNGGTTAEQQILCTSQNRS